MGIKHAYQSGTVNSAGSEVSSTRWNSDHAIDSEVPFAVLAADPAVATSGKLQIFAKKFAGVSFPAFRGESGIAQVVQSALWGPRVCAAIAAFNSASFTILGTVGIVFTGTATLRNFASTNLFTRTPRLQALSAATALSLAGARNSIVSITTGDGAGLGGFYFSCRFGCSDAATVAGARQFVGVGSNAAPSNVEPNTLTNSIGVGHGTSDATLSIYFGGTAAQTPIALGANFPANTLSVDMYELTLHSPSDAAGIVYWRVERIGDAANAQSGQLSGGSAVLPTSTSHLSAIQAWRSNNNTALAVGLDIAHIYLHTDK